MKNKGFFITFEGIDGSGKSTQIQNLAKFLKTLGFDIVITREPGGSVGGEEIRNLLLQGEVDRWSAETEILLFTAARRDHLESGPANTFRYSPDSNRATAFRATSSCWRPCLNWPVVL